MKKYTLIGLGGFLGAILRYLIKETTFFTINIPINIIIINLVGTFLLTFFLTLTLKYKINPNLKLGIATGFFGAFTTFSTFCKDIILLVDQGNYFGSIIYILLSIIIGMYSAYLGLELANYVIRKKVMRNNS